MPAPDTRSPLRQRLFERVRRSAAAGRAMHTTRLREAPAIVLAPGVTQRRLYTSELGRPPRPGEPQRVSLVELAAGASWPTPALDQALQRDWLVLHGALQIGTQEIGTQELTALDFVLLPAGEPCPTLHSAGGALLLLREAELAAAPDASTAGIQTRRAADATWAGYGPGIERCVLWQRDGQAAMLYRTVAGATVPRHVHHHDEECLMLAGDIFLDEVLLRPLDYQLAPAGSVHDSVFTDTGVLLYAHGDADLDLQAGPGAPSG